MTAAVGSEAEAEAPSPSRSLVRRGDPPVRNAHGRWVDGHPNCVGVRALCSAMLGSARANLSTPIQQRKLEAGNTIAFVALDGKQRKTGKWPQCKRINIPWFYSLADGAVGLGWGAAEAAAASSTDTAAGSAEGVEMEVADSTDTTTTTRRRRKPQKRTRKNHGGKQQHRRNYEGPRQNEK